MGQSTLENAVRRNLITLRRNTGWTRERFAHEVGLDGTHYKEMELGKTAVLLRDLDIMMEHMNIDPVELFRGHSKVDFLYFPKRETPSKSQKPIASEERKDVPGIGDTLKERTIAVNKWGER